MPKAKTTRPKTKPAKKAAARSKKPVVKKKQRMAATINSPRRIQLPKRRWYKPQTWRDPTPLSYKPLPKARKLFAAGLRELWQHKRLFGGVVIVFGLLNIVLVRGLAGSSDLTSFKSALDSIAHGAGGKIASSFATFAYLLASSGTGSAQSSGIYQYVLLIVCSLAFIWALRQVAAGHLVRVRDSFYQGMYPLIPFLLLLLLMGLQFLPLTIGGGLYSTVISNNIAVHLWEKALWLVLFIALALWSLRMITATIFALYIVTLPDMAPLRAYRTAKELVYRRRLLLWRKLIFLPVILLILAALIELPLILWVTPFATWVFFVLSMVALPVVHSYLYRLYREML